MEQPKVVEKPWGREIWWAHTDRYVGKIIEVKAGHALSLQYHKQKMETLYFTAGAGELQIGEEVHPIQPGMAVTLTPGTVHRVTATTDVTFLEASTPEVDDVVRLDDRYGRSS